MNISSNTTCDIQKSKIQKKGCAIRNNKKNPENTRNQDHKCSE